MDWQYASIIYGYIVQWYVPFCSLSRYMYSRPSGMSNTYIDRLETTDTAWDWNWDCFYWRGYNAPVTYPCHFRQLQLFTCLEINVNSMQLYVGHSQRFSTVNLQRWRSGPAHQAEARLSASMCYCGAECVSTGRYPGVITITYLCKLKQQVPHKYTIWEACGLAPWRHK